MAQRSFTPLSGGTFLITIATASATALHTVPAAVVGAVRGDIVHLTLTNSNAAARTITLSNGTDTQVVSLPANGVVEMDLWLDPGASLTGQASDTDVKVGGYVQRIA